MASESVTVDDLAETVTIPNLSATVTIKGFDFTFQSVAGYYALTGQDVEIDKLYIMAAAQGSYAVTGQDLGLSRSLILSADQGAYALSGQDLGLFFGYYAFADQGSYALTGQDNTLLRNLLVANDPGSYVLSGQDVTLSRDIILLMDGGSYNLGGQDMIPRFGFSEPIEQGSYTLTGQDVTLSRDLLINSTSGSYTLTGQSVDLDLIYYLALSSGSYTLTGQAVTLTYYEPPSVSYITADGRYGTGLSFATSTHNGISIGTADDRRWVVLGVANLIGTISGITCDGAAMSLIGSQQTKSQTTVSIWAIEKPTGTTADFVFTFTGANCINLDFGVLRLLTSVDPTAGGLHDDQQDTDGSVSINVPPDGAMVGVAATENTGNPAWTNATKVYGHDFRSNDYCVISADDGMSEETGRVVSINTSWCLAVATFK